MEDFELTYRLREFGWETKVSATVRAYTDAMTDLRSLWAQRMKWEKGTVNDLLQFGVNRLTLRDWWQQALGFVAIAAAWFTASWVRVLAEKLFRLQPKDLWKAQAHAERGRRIPTVGLPTGATT